MSEAEAASQKAWHCVQCGTPKNHPHSHGRIFLVRHGQTDYNKERREYGDKDIPLNEEGLAQAEQAAESLRDQKIDLIISSDLLRTRQTAEAIARATGAEIVYEEKIRERSAGVISGMLKTEWHPLYPNAFKDYHYRIPEGESYADLEERVKDALKIHRKLHRHKNIVFVTHGGTIRVIFKLIRNWNPEQAIDYPGTPNGYPLELETGEPCPVCGSDLYEDQVALAKFTAKKQNDPIYNQSNWLNT